MNTGADQAVVSGRLINSDLSESFAAKLRNKSFFNIGSAKYCEPYRFERAFLLISLSDKYREDFLYQVKTGADQGTVSVSFN